MKHSCSVAVTGWNLRPLGLMDFASETRIILTSCRGSDPRRGTWRRESPPGSAAKISHAPPECIGCHTAPRGTPAAGDKGLAADGHAINITPDHVTKHREER